MKSIKFRHKNFKKVKIKSSHESKIKKYLNYLNPEISFTLNDEILLLILKINFLLFFISIDVLILKSNLFIAKISSLSKKNNDKLLDIISYINSYKNITLEEIQDFRQYSRENKYIDYFKGENPHFEKNKFPSISIIVLTYNYAHCIHKCIKSIQNQSIKNIEILIIDDCSLDNTTDIIKQYQEEDPRIILYSHDLSEGSMKTISESISKVKGEYVTIINGNDAFTHKDILKHSLSIATIGNIDIIEFQAGEFYNTKLIKIINDYSVINLTSIIYQPELKYKFITISDNEGIRAIQNRYIYSKIIKTDIFKKAIKYIGKKYTNDYFMQYEDVILSFSLNQISQSYYYMKELGYYYSKEVFKGKLEISKDKVCKINPKKDEFKDMDHIKLFNFLYEKTKNNELNRQLIYHEIVSIHHRSSLVVNTNHHYEFVINILDKMIKCEFMSNRQKQRLMSFKSRIQDKQQNNNNT